MKHKFHIISDYYVQKLLFMKVCYLLYSTYKIILYILCTINFFGSTVTPTVIKIIKEFFLYACLTAYDPLNFQPGQCSVSWIKMLKIHCQ